MWLRLIFLSKWSFALYRRLSNSFRAVENERTVKDRKENPKFKRYVLKVRRDIKLIVNRRLNLIID